jgi:hypothetical protein
MMTDKSSCAEVFLPIAEPGTVTDSLRDWIMEHADLGLIYVPRVLRPVLIDPPLPDRLTGLPWQHATLPVHRYRRAGSAVCARCKRLTSC